MSSNPPWVILKKLGEGGGGEIFLARNPSGDTVAVKCLHSQEAMAEGSLEKEAGLLMRLQHPGLARVYGYLKNSETIFGNNRGPSFWMEFVEGTDLLTAAKGLVREREETILRWLREALEALEYLHREKVIHGDITPENLRIDASGRLRFLDFGLASIGRIEISSHEGTLLYMAPERFQGLQDAAGDLYSLGTVIYEALSGTHPRAGCRSLTAMLQTDPPPLAQVCKNLAPALLPATRVIDAMASSRPSDRFGSAPEALQALQSGEIPEPSKDSLSYFSRVFFAADEGLCAVDEALAHIPQRPAWFAIHGITGVGRTRFLNEIAFRASLRGIAVLEVAPSDFAAGLEHLQRRPDAAVFIFRGLEKVPLRELSQILSMHRALSPDKGCWVALEWNDDAMDPESRRLLMHSPIGSRWTEILLRNLDCNETREFLSGGLGESLSREVGEDLFKATQGNPKLLGDWVALLRKRGWDSKKHFAKDWLESEEKSWDVGSLQQMRLEGLDRLETVILEALCLDRGPVRLEEVIEVLRPDLEGDSEDDPSWRTIAALDALRASEMVQVDADESGHAVYRIALSPLVEAVRGRMKEERKTALHGLWIEALRHEPDDHERKVRHLIALGERGRVVPALEKLSERLRGDGHQRKALSLIEEALRVEAITQDSACLSRLLRMKTNVLNELGLYGDALACAERNYELAASDEPLSFKTTKYWLVTGLIHERMGDVSEALRRFEECRVAAKNLPEPQRSSYLGRSLTLEGKQLMSLGRKQEAIQRFQSALAIESLQGSERAETCRNLAIMRFDEGDNEGSQALLMKAGELYRTAGHYRGEFAVHLLSGNLALQQEAPDRAAAAYDHAESVALSHRNDLLLARVWNNQGSLSRKRGELAAAWDRHQKALEIFRSLGSPSDFAESLKQNAVTEAQLGRFEPAARLVRELEAMVQKEPRLERKWVEARRSLLAMSAGDDAGSAVAEDVPAWNVEMTLATLARGGRDRERLKELLIRVYDALPKGLQVSFVDRFDYRKWVLNQEGES